MLFSAIGFLVRTVPTFGVRRYIPYPNPRNLVYPKPRLLYCILNPIGQP
jgi:hypothetical protein